jgi:hypothetical protein
VKKLESKILTTTQQCKFEKYISFEQMGRLMYLLDIFDIVEFDDQCKCNLLPIYRSGDQFQILLEIAVGVGAEVEGGICYRTSRDESP